MPSITISTTAAVATHLIKQAASRRIPVAEIARRAVLEGIGEVTNALLKEYGSDEQQITIEVTSQFINNISIVERKQLGVALMIGLELIDPSVLKKEIVVCDGEKEKQLLDNLFYCRILGNYIEVSFENEYESNLFKDILGVCPGITLFSDNQKRFDISHLDGIDTGEIGGARFMALIDETSFMLSTEASYSKEDMLRIVLDYIAYLQEK